jgi:HNH endonuclease/AP2 domain
MKEIPLSDGSVALVDDDDYEWASQFSWSANGNGYAVRGVHIGNRKYRKIYLHREIIGAKKGQKVDHINGNKLDNRKENLRLATPAQNAMNIGLRRNNTSGLKGVRFEERRDKWRAEIKVNYKNVFLGYFDNKFDAAKAYNDAAIKYHGEFARLNYLNKGEVINE